MRGASGGDRQPTTTRCPSDFRLVTSYGERLESFAALAIANKTRPHSSCKVNNSQACLPARTTAPTFHTDQRPRRCRRRKAAILRIVDWSSTLGGTRLTRDPSPLVRYWTALEHGNALQVYRLRSPALLRALEVFVTIPVTSFGQYSIPTRAEHLQQVSNSLRVAFLTAD